MSQTIAITGANSYIGHHLIDEALRQGLKIRALTRGKSDRCLEKFAYKIDFFEFDLEEGCLEEALEGVDCIIHLAWYRPSGTRSENDHEINFEGTRKLLEVAKLGKVSKRIFLSSQLASPKAYSFYARNKYEVEKLWEDKKDFIVRTGYVFGGTPYGFYEKTLKNLEKSSLMPIIRKRAPLNPIHIQDLVRLLLKMVCDPNVEGNRIYSVGSKRPITLENFFKLLGRNCFQKEIIVFSLPAHLLYRVAYLFSFLHKAFNDLSERLGGILSAKSMKTEGDLERLGIELKETNIFIRKGFKKVLQKEGIILSQYLFGKRFHGLAGRYAETIQSYPYSKPLPIPKLFTLFPSLIGMMEPLAGLKKNDLIRTFQKRIQIMIQLKEMSDIGDFKKGEKPLLTFIKRISLVSIREILFLPFRLLTHLILLTRFKDYA